MLLCTSHFLMKNYRNPPQISDVAGTYMENAENQQVTEIKERKSENDTLGIITFSVAGMSRTS